MTLPKVNYDVETEEISVDTSIRTPLNINGLPVATSFAVYQQSPRFYFSYNILFNVFKIIMLTNNKIYFKEYSFN